MQFELKRTISLIFTCNYETSLQLTYRFQEAIQLLTLEGIRKLATLFAASIFENGSRGTYAVPGIEYNNVSLVPILLQLSVPDETNGLYAKRFWNHVDFINDKRNPAEKALHPNTLSGLLSHSPYRVGTTIEIVNYDARNKYPPQRLPETHPALRARQIYLANKQGIPQGMQTEISIASTLSTSSTSSSASGITIPGNHRNNNTMQKQNASVNRPGISNPGTPTGISNGGSPFVS